MLWIALQSNGDLILGAGYEFLRPDGDIMSLVLALHAYTSTNITTLAAGARTLLMKGVKNLPKQALAWAPARR